MPFLGSCTKGVGTSEEGHYARALSHDFRIQRIWYFIGTITDQKQKKQKYWAQKCNFKEETRNAKNFGDGGGFENCSCRERKVYIGSSWRDDFESLTWLFCKLNQGHMQCPSPFPRTRLVAWPKVAEEKLTIDTWRGWDSFHTVIRDHPRGKLKKEHDLKWLKKVKGMNQIIGSQSHHISRFQCHKCHITLYLLSSCRH